MEAVEYSLDEAQSLLKTLVCEAECTTLKHYSNHSPCDESKQGEKSGRLLLKRLLCGDGERCCSLIIY